MALVRLLERLLTNASSDVTVVKCVCVCKRKIEIEKMSLHLLQQQNINIRNTLTQDLFNNCFYSKTRVLLEPFTYPMSLF